MAEKADTLEPPERIPREQLDLSGLPADHDLTHHWTPWKRAIRPLLPLGDETYAKQWKVRDKDNPTAGYRRTADTLGIPPGKTGLYEWALGPADAAYEDQLFVLYLGKAGPHGTLRTRLMAYLSSGSHLGPYMQEFLHLPYETRARKSAAVAVEWVFWVRWRVLRNVVDRKQKVERLESHLETSLLKRYDYALNKIHNKKRRLDDIRAYRRRLLEATT